MPRKVIIGITGSIAAYKSVLIVRQLIKLGHEVRCVCTPDALDFVGSITLSTLSKNPIISTLINDGEWTEHVSNGLWADLMLIAPATLNTIGRAANGICDNALLAIYFSAKCPVFWAPAMDLDMYLHPAFTANIEKLKSYGNHIIEANNGELASGLIGQGRMAEPDDIIRFLRDFL